MVIDDVIGVAMAMDDVSGSYGILEEPIVSIWSRVWPRTLVFSLLYPVKSFRKYSHSGLEPFFLLKKKKLNVIFP